MMNLREKRRGQKKYVGSFRLGEQKNLDLLPADVPMLIHRQDYFNPVYEDVSSGISKMKREGGRKSRVGYKLFSVGTPALIDFSEVYGYGKIVFKFSKMKALFCFLGALYTLFFGSFNLLHWASLLFTTLHAITRIALCHQKKKADDLELQQNMGRFFIPYFWLALGNGLNQIVVLNGLPVGTFLAIYQLSIVHIELTGFVQNATRMGWQIPKIIRKFLQHPDDSLPF